MKYVCVFEAVCLRLPAVGCLQVRNVSLPCLGAVFQQELQVQQPEQQETHKSYAVSRLTLQPRACFTMP